NVITVVGCQRPRIAEVIYLHWRRTPRKHAESWVLGKTLQVNRDINFEFPHQLCDLLICLVPNIEKMLNCVRYSPAHLRTPISAKRYSAYFKPRFVVLFKQASNKIRGCVIMKISG